MKWAEFYEQILLKKLLILPGKHIKKIIAMWLVDSDKREFVIFSLWMAARIKQSLDYQDPVSEI